MQSACKTSLRYKAKQGDSDAAAALSIYEELTTAAKRSFVHKWDTEGRGKKGSSGLSWVHSLQYEFHESESQKTTTTRGYLPMGSILTKLGLK